MAKTKYVIALTDEERAYLNQIIADPDQTEHAILRARILLVSDLNKNKKMSVEKVAEAVGTTHTTVQTVRKEYGQGGIDAALFRKTRTVSRETRKINEQVIGKVLALTKEDPPEGHKRWTAELLRQTCIDRGIIDSISAMSVSRILKREDVKLK